MKISISFLELIFKEPAGTSRGILKTKPSWFIEVSADGKIGKGEISIIPGLSMEYADKNSFERKINQVANIFRQFPVWDWMLDKSSFTFIPLIEKELANFPSIRMGFEMAYFNWFNEHGNFFLKSHAFSRMHIPINGLVWMGAIPTMRLRMREKIAEGFTTVKMKIGSLDWNSEKELLTELRNQFAPAELTIRVDANGAFEIEKIEEILHYLKLLNVHSIEQPLAKGSIEETARLQDLGLVDIAIDEELIGIECEEDMFSLLEKIKVTFIVLKPSIHGGFKGTKKWISCAEKLGMGWWITSALESSCGLQAIAEFTEQFSVKIPQGLGTGAIYQNNLPSNLVVNSGYLKTQK